MIHALGTLKLNEFEVIQDMTVPPSCDSSERSKCTEVRIVQIDPINLEVDFINIHVSLVNAFRRIIIAEVPTMAIETVNLYNNTSILQDEVLCHRLGLIPLMADPRLFEFRAAGSTEYAAHDTVKYELNVRCSNNPKSTQDESHPDKKYINNKVLTKSIKWVPMEGQAGTLQEETMKPLDDETLIAKMNPGQEIELDMYAVKGVGRDHGKFQPGIAWHRFLPQIKLKRQVEGQQADLLQRCFSPRVINVVTNKEGKRVAEVANARYDSSSRNVFQYDSIKDSVELSCNAAHIILHVESMSCLKSWEILEESMSIMIEKCSVMLKELDTGDISEPGTNAATT